MIYVFALLVVSCATFFGLRGHKLSFSSYYYYSYSLLISILCLLFIFCIKEFIYKPLCEINQVVAYIIYYSNIALAIFYFSKNYFAITPKNDVILALEQLLKKIFFLSNIITMLLMVLVVGIVFFQALKFFTKVSPLAFMFGLSWQPSSTDIANSFGAAPVFLGTLLITLIAIMVAVPLGLLSAIYLSEYASKKTRKILKPSLEIISGMPTIVYGYFAALIVCPLIRALAERFSLNISAENALGAGIVMGIMIMPFILSMSDDIIGSIPKNLREASLALGATKAETICKIVMPAAMPAISNIILLSISRAIGETIIVSMAAGLNANLTFNPLNAVTTVTAQIVSLVNGDQEFDNPKTLSAFALTLMLFFTTLMLNMLAMKIIKNYRAKYA
jgi:phosphate transport system permease protein